MAGGGGLLPQPTLIFVDSNIFVIDLRYRRDPVYIANKRFLEKVADSGRGVTGLINVLEVCGILSFNLPAHLVRGLYSHLGERYRILVVPAATDEAVVAHFKAEDLVGKMSLRMGLKDAEIALIAERLVPRVECFVTWNAKHFEGRISCRVQTPGRWLRSR